MKVFESLRQKMAGRTRDRLEQLKELRATIADGRKVDEDAASELLEQLEMTPEQLAEQVETLKRRREWANQVTTGQKAEQDYQSIKQQIEDGEAELKELVRKHEEKMQPIVNRKGLVLQAMSAGNSAESSLRDSATDPEAYRATEAVEAERKELQAECSGVERRLKDVIGWIDTVEARGQTAADEDIERLPEMRKKGARLQAEYDAYHARFESLNDKWKEASKALLDPNAI